MTSLWLDTRGQAAAVDGTEALADTSYDVVVVGAGITGLATAHLLTAAGRSVLVLEARAVGAVATGNTTAKVSLLQGSVYSGIRSHAGETALADYAAGNREAQQWIVDLLGDGPSLQHRDAVTYAETVQGRARLRSELQACREAGLDVVEVGGDDLELPFSATGILLADQAQIHPLALLDRMVRGVREAGGRVVEGVRVTGLSAGEPHQLHTTAGPVRGRHVVLATGTPVLDRGLHFARLLPQRSYALAYAYDGPVPQGMYLSVDRRSRSLRSAPVDGRDYLVVGGNGHTVGRHGSTQGRVDELHGWAQHAFPGARLTHQWSAQDYRTTDRMPLAGPLLPGQDTVHVATGFNKWGMTNGVAAAMVLAGRVTGDAPSWGGSYTRRGYGPRRAAEALKLNLEVGAFLGGGWALANLRPLPDTPPGEGEGHVGRDGLAPVAASTVDGTTRTVSGVCTHLGGVLRWNDAECSWDCPLHGSRFAPDGAVLEGPATRPLPPRDA